MKILITGNYSADYNRIAILLAGMRMIKEISLIEYPFKSKKDFNKARFQEMCADVDVIFLPSFTHNEVSFIRKITNKPIVFDPLISRYLTKVFDYKLVWKYSPRALKNYLKDKYAFRAATLIFADTQAHKDYYCSTFKINPDKIQVLPIGVNCHDFSPSPIKTTHPFIVGFYGGFIPLQGVEQILDAAHQLISQKSIQFQLIGNGFEYDKMLQKAKLLNLTNVSFLGWVQYESLAQRIAEWDVCLGIFGNTHKSDLVIPNKIYHYAAMNKPIITKDSPAIREIFTPNETVFLCSTSPIEIAKMIVYVKEHSVEREEIAANALKLISAEFNEKSIAEKFIAIVKKKIV